MALQLRRVVTGHDPAGKAVVTIDEVCRNVVSPRAGVSACVAWTTEGFPVDNDGADDGALRPTGTTHDNGTVFRIIEFAPGNAERNHRTDSIDYAVIVSGEIDMDLDGEEVHLKAGDVVVQRGTIHNWINRGTEPCVIAFVLIAAHSAVAGGKALPAVG
ncbi:MAG: cupin domain-containing protein [Alphaproteobacteria bacterium]|nr:cupin domain-containing protein [Alphaproteobacteria bacterium]